MPPERPSISEIGTAFAAGLSPVKLVQDCLDRIATSNGTIKAMILVDADGALEAARSAETEIRAGRSRGPLHGIPVAVKDMIDVEGWPTTAGSRLFAGRIAQTDATCIANLRAAGAIIIGKTNLHELTVGPFDNAWYGKVVNPLDPARGTGGTSSGSAAAVAAGFCVAAIGTDTGGSNRSVAAATGLVGFKPTNGLIDPAGALPTASSLDTIGPIAACIGDIRLMTEAMLGRSLGPPHATRPLDDITLALCPDLYATDIDPTIERSYQAWTDRLRRSGLRVVERPFAHQDEFVRAGITILMHEFAEHYGHMIEASPDRVGTPVLAFLAEARAVSPADLAAARVAREQAKAQRDRLMDGVDVLAIPTTPGLGPRLSDELTRVGDMQVPYGMAGGRFRRWANMLGMPALALPLPTDEALPASIQLAALPNDDSVLLELAASIAEAG